MNSISDPNQKHCRSCRHTLLLAAFGTKPNGKIYAKCAECREKDRIYRETHKEEITAYKKIYYEEHLDEERIKHQEYYQEHAEEIKERVRQYKKDHKEEKAEMDRQYREKHKTKMAEYKRIYYLEHRAETLERVRLYKIEHPEVAQLYYDNHREELLIRVAARRAKKKGNGGIYTVNDLVELYELQNGRCCWCGKEMVNRLVYKGASKMVIFTIDHIKAVYHGGSSYPHNLVLACSSCNSTKHKREIFNEWQPPNMLEWMLDYVKHALEIENEQHFHDTNETHT